ncbi:hypothetical protein GALL_324170 [mine drainage metagenome]|uniref:Uncharacterized protein n=1 Tax=mine drainage metagenome TaxID=410659 RepID=A0A1J5QQS2_9ZZZZ
MNRTAVAAIATLSGALLLAGCGSSPSPLVFASASASVVLPVSSDPIVNTATAPTLSITYAAAENNIDQATGKTIADRLELTLKNTGTTPLTGFEVYYTMTDAKTGKKEAYYQKIADLILAAGQASTVYFDNKTDPGHYPENPYSIYRTSTNQVDFAIQVSATGAKIATATATKSPGTGEKVD